MMIYIFIEENPDISEFEDIAACDFVGGIFIPVYGVGISVFLEAFGDMVAAEKA